MSSLKEVVLGPSEVIDLALDTLDMVLPEASPEQVDLFLGEQEV